MFWAGAIAEMGERDLTAVTETLRELSRKELVRPARRSSIEGEAEYAFWHVLARDVAYGQLPRASRASRHVAAARWIESKAPERVEDLADVLPTTTPPPWNSRRPPDRPSRLPSSKHRRLKFLTLAGERALGLDTAAALSNLERALALTPAGHPERPEALARFGEAANQAGRYAEAAEALEEAIASFRTAGRPPRRRPRDGHARQRARPRSGTRGAGRSRWKRSELLEPLGPSPELVGALTEVAVVDAIQGRSEDGDPLAERALELASRARPSPSRPRPRLPGHGPRRPRGPRWPRGLP